MYATVGSPSRIAVLCTDSKPRLPPAATHAAFIVWESRLGRVSEGDEERRRSVRSRAKRDRLKASKEIYDDARVEFRFHCDINSGLDKKAHSLMAVTVLAATLFVSVSACGAGGWWDQNQVWQTSAMIFLIGMIVTVGLCILVSQAWARSVPTVRKMLVCYNKTDDEAYEGVVTSGRRDYYKSRTKEYMAASAEQERRNKKKRVVLDVAYGWFAIFIIAIIPALVIGVT